MSRPTLPDLVLYLASVYDPSPTPPAGEGRLELLRRTHAGAIYEPGLARSYSTMTSLPAAVVGDKSPLAKELAEADDDHDAWVDAIDHLTAAVRVAPSTPAEVRSRVERLRALLPAKGAKTRGYADEAFDGRTWRGVATTHEADLATLALPWEGDGRTFADWVLGLSDSADALGALLEDRSDALRPASSSDRSAATTLRSTTIGLINNCRTALAAEVADNPELPPDLDSRIFGFLDDLAAKRSSSKGKSDGGGGYEPKV